MSKPGDTRLPWGRALGALIAVAVVIVVTRGVLEILLVAAIILLLVGSYVLRHYSRRRLVYGRRDDQPQPHPGLTRPAASPSRAARSVARVWATGRSGSSGDCLSGVEYRVPGRSGLRVSVLTMGAMTFGGKETFANVGSTDLGPPL